MRFRDNLHGFPQNPVGRAAHQPAFEKTFGVHVAEDFQHFGGARSFGHACGGHGRDQGAQIAGVAQVKNADFEGFGISLLWISGKQQSSGGGVQQARTDHFAAIKTTQGCVVLQVFSGGKGSGNGRPFLRPGHPAGGGFVGFGRVTFGVFQGFDRFFVLLYNVAGEFLGIVRRFIAYTQHVLEHELFPTGIVGSASGGQVPLPGAFRRGLAHHGVEVVYKAVFHLDAFPRPHFGGSSHGIPNGRTDEHAFDFVVKFGSGEGLGRQLNRTNKSDK